jgi:hypothetical protein
MANTKLSKLFITGCDASSEWMLPWFVDNLTKHNDIPLMIMDFGMTSSQFSDIRKSVRGHEHGWFKKPKAMRIAAEYAENVCWLDTDCEVMGNISKIFEYIQPNKLSMAVDKPWTQRRGEKWHNSGVVAYHGVPSVLTDWELSCATQPVQGDQEVLHMMMDNPLKRMTFIEDLPNKYNVLRIQHIDKTVPAGPLVYHWTGQKGKDHIRKLMNG